MSVLLDRLAGSWRPRLFVAVHLIQIWLFVLHPWAAYSRSGGKLLLSFYGLAEAWHVLSEKKLIGCRLAATGIGRVLVSERTDLRAPRIGILPSTIQAHLDILIDWLFVHPGWLYRPLRHLLLLLAFI